MTNQPDEFSTPGDVLGSKRSVEEVERVRHLAYDVYRDLVDVTVHMNLLLDAIRELRKSPEGS